MRLARCEVRDHINYRKNDRWPSYRFYRALQRLKSPMRYVCEIFGAPRFSSFSTQSALFGPHAMSDLSPECAPKRTSVDHSDFMGSRPKRAAKDNHRPGRAPGFLIRDRANGRCDALLAVLARDAGEKRRRPEIGSAADPPPRARAQELPRDVPPHSTIGCATRAAPTRTGQRLPVKAASAAVAAWPEMRPRATPSSRACCTCAGVQLRSGAGLTAGVAGTDFTSVQIRGQ